MITNCTDETANIRLSVLFSHREPQGKPSAYSPRQEGKVLPAGRTYLSGGYQIPFGQYALMLESDRPVVAVFGRLDRRKDVSYYSVAGYGV